MALQDYVLLGRSGLRVSRLSLGGMTFGEDFGWGAPEAVVREMLDAYVEAGGNFIDTANVYTLGKSEEMIGRYIKERALRDKMVLATKFTFNTQPGNPNGGGNGRKNMIAALDASLQRLSTDYVDLYFLHVWDRLTPVEEVMRTFDDLVCAGKVRHVGFSDVPAWWAAQAQTVAHERGSEPAVALQLEYSLLERNIEREHVDMARTLGLAIVAWSPLASGLLSGKYKPSGAGKFGEGRLQIVSDQAEAANPKLNETNFAALERLKRVADALGHSMAQVAVNWVANRPGVASVILGATKPDQLLENLQSLDFEIPGELAAELEAMAAPKPVFPHTMFTGAWQSRVHGGVGVAETHPHYARPVRITAKP